MTVADGVKICGSGKKIRYVLDIGENLTAPGIVKEITFIWSIKIWRAES